MANNVSSSSSLSQEQLMSLAPKFVVYAIQGSVTLALSFTIFLAVLRHGSLRERKEYVFISALAFTDSLSAFALVTAGLGRLYLILSGQAMQLVSRMDCLFTVWNICWLITDHTGGAMLMLISLDRLFMVCSPLRYMGYTSKHALAILFLIHIPYGCMISRLVLELLLAADLPLDKPNICFTSYIYDLSYYHVVYSQKAIFSTLSVCLYLLVLIKYRQKQKAIAPALAKAAVEIEKKKQRRLTVTLGFSCLATLIFVVVPLFLRNVLAKLDSSNAFMSEFLALLGPIEYFNPALNFALYYKRHLDIKAGIRSLYGCKSLHLIDAEGAAGIPARQWVDGDL